MPHRTKATPATTGWWTLFGRQKRNSIPPSADPQAPGTTAGIRAARLERTVLDREMRQVATRFGEIPVKVLSRGGRVISVSPEYEECRRIAKERQVPLKEVYDEAKKTAAAMITG